MSEPDRRAYAAPALEKGLDVLEWLSTAPRAQSTGEIASALSRSRSEIFRMLNVLEARGYIARDAEADGFVLTTRLLELAMRRAPTRSLLEAALPEMEALAEATRQSCHIAVRSGDEMVVIARVESPDEFGFAVGIGFRRPLPDATSGRVLLAFPPRTHARMALPKGVDAQALERDLARIRRHGFRRAKSADVSGIVDLGVPIFGDTSEGAVAALTIPFVQRRGEHRPIAEVLAALREAGRRISAALGHVDRVDDVTGIAAS